MVPFVYFFFVGFPSTRAPTLFSLTYWQPETAYRSLEEMDEIFQEVHGFKGAFDVVKVARNKPHRYGKHGELLINYEDTEAAVRRRSSLAGAQAGTEK